MMIAIGCCSYVVFLTLFLVSSVMAQQDNSSSGSEPPRWFGEHMEYMTGGTGRWIADNTPFISETEPYDSYGTEWKWGIGRKSMTGRLFGLKEGKESGDFWQFRVFWHPGESRAHIHQYAGTGLVGIGTMDSTAGGMIRTEQQFYGTDGTVFSVGHETWEWDGDHHTQSYDITTEGGWEKRRYYIWKPAP